MRVYWSVIELGSVELPFSKRSAGNWGGASQIGVTRAHNPEDYAFARAEFVQ